MLSMKLTCFSEFLMVIFLLWILYAWYYLVLLKNNLREKKRYNRRQKYFLYIFPNSTVISANIVNSDFTILANMGQSRSDQYWAISVICIGQYCSATLVKVGLANGRSWTSQFVISFHILILFLSLLIYNGGLWLEF